MFDYIVKANAKTSTTFTIRSKIIKECVFKDKQPRKPKSDVDWEKEEWFKKSMVDKIQQIQKKNKTRQKGQPQPWRDGTQLGWVCQILLMWK
jgi:hypothetical protein